MLSPPRSSSTSSSPSSSDIFPSVAYATLITSTDYLDAALTLAQSLRATHTRHPILALIQTDTIPPASVRRLRALFDHIIPVDPIVGVSSSNLSLIGRPDLAATLTKLHCWSLTQYARVLFLDADTLVCGCVDHLFDLPPSVEFAAAPELGFPDCFNAGVMLLTPSESTYGDLLWLAAREQSFDGGDQGLLNVFFGDGTRHHPSKDVLQDPASTKPFNKIQNHLQTPCPTETTPRNWYRLSSTYNMEMHKVYRMYIPAVLRYRDEIKILHFIGKDKPWHFTHGKVDAAGGSISPYFDFYAEMVGRWWDVRRMLPLEC